MTQTLNLIDLLGNKNVLEKNNCKTIHCKFQNTGGNL